MDQDSIDRAVAAHSEAVLACRAFAIAAHGDQRYGDRDYVYHLDRVASLLRDRGEPAVMAGYLHDVLEDTATTRAELEARFGEFVAACVDLVTDPVAPTRKARKAALYERLARVRGELELALVVKVADRLANVAACVADDNASLLARYREEHPSLRAAAYRPGLCDELWRALDALAAT